MNQDSENKFPDDAKLEAQLSTGLNRLPDASLASNFTARVLQAIELEDLKNAPKPHWDWRFLFPRFAVAAAILIFAGIGFQHYETNSHRTLLARTVAQVAASQPLPSVEALENLDAIQRMDQPRADENLLALLQ